MANVYLPVLFIFTTISVWKIISSMLLLSCFARNRQRRWPPFLTNVRCISTNGFLQGISSFIGSIISIVAVEKGVSTTKCLITFSTFYILLVHRALQTLFVFIQCCCKFTLKCNSKILDRVDIINGVLLVASVIAVIPQMLLVVVAEETVYECGTDSIFTDPQYVLHVFVLLIGLPSLLSVFLYVCLRLYVRYRARTTSVFTPVLVQPHVLAQPNADKRRSRNRVFPIVPLSDKNNGSTLKSSVFIVQASETTNDSTVKPKDNEDGQQSTCSARPLPDITCPSGSNNISDCQDCQDEQQDSDSNSRSVNVKKYAQKIRGKLFRAHVIALGTMGWYLVADSTIPICFVVIDMMSRLVEASDSDFIRYSRLAAYLLLYLNSCFDIFIIAKRYPVIRKCLLELIPCNSP